MAGTSLNCSVSQGFNFQKDAQILVGHINKLKVSTTDFDADFNVTDPENIKGGIVKVVGIVSGIYWNGGYADPIEFSCQVSTNNKNKAALLTHKELSDTQVLLQFTIYDYDPKAKKYYQCFHCNKKDLKGLVSKAGGSLAINIDMDQSMEVVSPKNYNFSLGVMPQDLDMAIQMAVSKTDKFAKKWGVEVKK